MRLVSIASGSSGNCIYIGSDNTHILIDAGISTRRIEKALAEIGVSMRDLSGVFVTHEHSDHICGLGVMSRKYEVPIFTTEGTYQGIRKTKSLGAMPEGLEHIIRADEILTVGDLKITSFATSHDAADPLGYRVDSEKASAAVVTDLGVYSQYTVSHLQNLDALLLEANHDIRMLECGPYPYYLKKRILGNRGHLSNEASGRLLGEVLHDGMKKVLLGHLSKENNYEDLAYETVRLEVTMGENQYKGSDFDISVASRTEMSEIINLG